MTVHDINFDAPALADFCRRHRIHRMALFGSILQPRFGPESDVDVLVEFDAAHKVGFDFFSIEDELSALLGEQVDLNTRAFLSRYFRDNLKTLELYDARRPSPTPAHP